MRYVYSTHTHTDTQIQMSVCQSVKQSGECRTNDLVIQCMRRIGRRTSPIGLTSLVTIVDPVPHDGSK